MSKRIIKFGKWNDKPIEWEILKENDFEILVISRDAIDRRIFDRSSSGSNWSKSNLRKFLEEEFYNKAFSVEEKKKIINTKLEDVDNSKDNVFVLSENEVRNLLATGDDYQHEKSCSNCAWTRTKSKGNVRCGFAVFDCWCSSTPGSHHSIRPAMFLKKNFKKSTDEYPTVGYSSNMYESGMEESDAFDIR